MTDRAVKAGRVALLRRLVAEGRLASNSLTGGEAAELGSMCLDGLALRIKDAFYVVSATRAALRQQGER